jgi:linearmycin/streptolysin S transport system ATP-binding protein
MIEVSGLRKVFGELTAVDGVSFTARGGEIFGLLGPNGAGKTTTLSCVSGLLKPTAGRVSILGHDVVADGTAAKRNLGVVPQEIALYEEVSATENLRYWGGTYGLGGADLDRRIQEVLDLTGLLDRAREPVKRFSGGMKRRLNFACGIVHRPRVLLLDEPTVGVDPQSRVRLLELVREEAGRGNCVLYTTHYMEEAEQLCDRLAVVDHGKLIAQGTLTELRGMTEERDVIRLAGRFPPDRVAAGLEALGGLQIRKNDGDQLVLSLREASRRLPKILETLTAEGAEIRETVLTQPSLESLFIELTGKELRE